LCSRAGEIFGGDGSIGAAVMAGRRGLAVGYSLQLQVPRDGTERRNISLMTSGLMGWAERWAEICVLLFDLGPMTAPVTVYA